LGVGAGADALGVIGALPEGVALALGTVVSKGAGEAVGPSATGREPFGRLAKKRGGRLKVGTSSQKGARGSSAKYSPAAGFTRSPAVSIRNGPISQSAGMARTTQKSTANPATNSQKLFRRRWRLSAFMGRTASRRICEPP
jgi:hypothetical protein